MYLPALALAFSCVLFPRALLRNDGLTWAGLDTVHLGRVGRRWRICSVSGSERRLERSKQGEAVGRRRRFYL